MERKVFIIIVISCLVASKGQDVNTKCSSIHPCDVNQGQCTVTADCKSNLICGQCQEPDTTSVSQCCIKPEQRIVVDSQKCDDTEKTKKCKKLKKKKKCKKKKVWKKCLKTCDRCDGSEFHVMITTGLRRYLGTRRTEIVDVANGGTCLDLPKFPVRSFGATGANLQGTPVVCGGATDVAALKSCFRFTNGEWEKFAIMKGKRLDAAGVVNNKKLHVFGGYNDKTRHLQTSETINIDGEVSDGPDLPTAVYGHAIAAINDTVSILTGGITNVSHSSSKTWYYNHETEAFNPGPNLLEGRSYHGSAFYVDKVTKAKIPIVTGDSTELLIDGQWQPGPPLPKTLSGHTMLEMHGDVFVFGGWDVDCWDIKECWQSAIHKLSCSSGICSWSTINAQLNFARECTVVIPVPSSFCTSNNSD